MQARRPAVHAGTTVPIDLGSVRQSEPVNAIGHLAGFVLGQQTFLPAGGRRYKHVGSQNSQPLNPAVSPASNAVLICS